MAYVKVANIFTYNNTLLIKSTASSDQSSGISFLLIYAYLANI